MFGRIARITNLFYNLIMYKLFFKLQKTVKSVLFAIYLRKGNITTWEKPKYHGAIVKFADGQQILYRVPILRVQNYTVDSIIEKRLLILLPYYILRYESFLKNSGNNTKKLEQLLADYQKISDALEQCMEDKKSSLYIDLITLIEKIADHIIPKENEKVRERLGDLMGGKILQLESERLRELGEAKGRAEGRKAERIEAIQNMISLGLTKEKILTIYSEEEYNEAVSTMLVEV